jgi:hypothetical protein
MRTYKVELSIDVPDQYEFSRLLNKDTVGDFRYPALAVDEIILETISFRGEPYWVVVRKAWQWPKWLTANYIAMDKNGEWCAYLTEPYIEETYWWVDDGVYRELGGGFTTFSSPPCNNWQESLRKNPNHK